MRNLIPKLYKKIKIVILRIVNIVFKVMDLFILKRSDYWIFPVYFLGEGEFNDNILAVFEAVKSNKGIKKIILTRSKIISVDEGINVVVTKFFSLKAAWYIIRSKIIFVQHSLAYEFGGSLFRLSFPRKRIIINLWHAIAVKDLTHPKIGIMTKGLEKELIKHHIITSSKADRINMQKIFYSAKKENFWLTGLPRNDFLITREDKLPSAVKNDLKKLRKLTNNKKLIIYTPTYKETRVGGHYYQFHAEEREKLKEFLHKNNFILGLRYHKYNEPKELLKGLIDNEFIIDVSSNIISNINVLIREAEIIITDYSSVYIDAMYLNKPLISFAYDFDHYLTNQHGFFYEYNEVFPGKICSTFNELIEALEMSINGSELVSKQKYKDIYKLFFEYSDANNTQRVIDKVNNLINR